MLGQLARPFADRRDGGAQLAALLSTVAWEDPVVLGLARGGVPVAHEVALALHAPLDVLVVRKIGAPGNPEFGIGALAEGGVLVLDEPTVRELYVSAEELAKAIARAREEVGRRVAHYRGERAAVEVAGRTAIVVDDGLATGGTARAALRATRARGPRRLVLAVPVAARQTLTALGDEADEIVYVLAPANLWAVGAWYADFTPTTDAEILELLARTCAK